MNPSASIALIVFIPDSRKRHRSGRGGYGNKRPKISSIVFLPRSAHRPEPRPRERITTMLLGCERAKWLQAHYAFMHYTRCSSRLKSDSVQVNRKMFKKKTIGQKRGKRYSLGRCLWESPHDTRKWSDKTRVLVAMYRKGYQLGTDKLKPTQRELHTGSKGQCAKTFPPGVVWS